MALRIALDTTRYIDFATGVDEAKGPLALALEVYVPYIALGELRSGFQFGNRADENERRLQHFLQKPGVAVLFADEATTHFYASIHADLRRRGTPIPTNDVWIAALALQHDLVLFTRDKHFELVPRLARI